MQRSFLGVVGENFWGGGVKSTKWRFIPNIDDSLIGLNSRLFLLKDCTNNKRIIPKSKRVLWYGNRLTEAGSIMLMQEFIIRESPLGLVPILLTNMFRSIAFPLRLTLFKVYKNKKRPSIYQTQTLKPSTRHLAHFEWMHLIALTLRVYRPATTFYYFHTKHILSAKTSKAKAFVPLSFY